MHYLILFRSSDNILQTGDHSFMRGHTAKLVSNPQIAHVTINNQRKDLATLALYLSDFPTN